MSRTVNGRAGPARLHTAHGPVPTAQRLWPHAHGEQPLHGSPAGSPRVGSPPLPPPTQRGDAHPLESVAKSWPWAHDTEVVSLGHGAHAVDPPENAPDLRFRRSGGVRGMSRPVGRVLSPCTSRCTMGDHPSRAAVAGNLVRSTRGLGRAALDRPRRHRSCDLRPLLTLLQVGFTEPHRSPGTLVVSYTTVSPLPPTPEGVSGGLLSVALSRGSPRVGVTHHLALWSPDLPRRSLPAVARPAHPLQG